MASEWACPQARTQNFQKGGLKHALWLATPTINWKHRTALVLWGGVGAWPPLPVFFLFWCDLGREKIMGSTMIIDILEGKLPGVFWEGRRGD